MFRPLLPRVYQVKRIESVAESGPILNTRTNRNFMTNSKRPEPLEVCWRLVEGSSTRILTCSMFASDSGVELRVGYVAQSPLYSQRVDDIEAARRLARNWLEALRAHTNADSNSR
jgi:hypothetical protein